ncbi:MAG: hypothetical protein MRQ13_04735 [Candidatus Midichloria sp.]|nr:hypothetical protein [Candidatus Midichloria sp.]
MSIFKNYYLDNNLSAAFFTNQTLIKPAAYNLIICGGINGTSSIVASYNSSEEKINNPFEENFCVHDDV